MVVGYGKIETRLSLLDSMPKNSIETEIKYFNAHREEWIALYEGKYALVKDENLLGTFDTEQAAYEAGVEKLGNEPMLIKKIGAWRLEYSFPGYLAH